MSMSNEAIDSFLKTPNRHAVLGTIRRSGAPQLSPVWYLYENGKMYVSVPEKSAKHRNLRRDPRVAVCIDGGRQDVRAVMLYGRVAIAENDDAFNREMRWRIVRAYYSTEEDAKSYYETVEDVPSVLLVITPDEILAQDFND